PFQHSNPIAVISQHLHEDPPRLSDYRPELAHLDDVFFKALGKQPAERFERCRAFAAAVAEQVDAVAEPSATGDATVLPHRRRGARGLVSSAYHRFSSRTRWSAALVCAVLIAVAATWSTLYSFAPETPQPNPALASRPSTPAASAAPRPGGPA